MSFNISALLSNQEEIVRAARARKSALLEEQRELLDVAKREHRDQLYSTEATRLESVKRDYARASAEYDAAKRKLDEIIAIRDEEAEVMLNSSTADPARHNEPPARTASVRIGSEPHTYSRDNDREGNGAQFLSDLVNSFRGEPTAQDRLARHQREWQVDNPKFQQRAAGDVLVAGFPNLVVPQLRQR